ncbi:uncharacterized protein LOC114928055, partial [Nylanderia fulva]|uniref:uncharacterized protein LOC114928055 n=1 Tax=Nylanderia fulva TaxID=613905 RepID=UPI0010FAD8A4
MASMGAPGNRNPLDVVNNAPYCLKIHGQYHHLTSTAMRPADGQAPRFAQLYFLDTEEAINHRMNKKANQECNKNINLMLSFRNDPQHDQRKYNAPQANEIAVVFQNVDGEPPFERDIRIYNKNSNDVQQISILDKRCDPMCYPLLYPYGNDGWHSEMKSYNSKYSGFKVTQMDYYAHLLAPRAEFSQFKRAGKLRCQFILDAYMKTEANRLNYIKLNQPQLRAELYSGLMDHLDNRAQNEGITVGVPVILPSSFMGSPRNMQERYQDAMSLVRKYGKPDIFLTMTCNPQCPEIKDNLDGCQIEGLPHLHLLAMLSDEDKPRLQEVIDMMVWAEIPNEEKYSELNEKVLKHMIHGPCGDPSRRYPCTGDDGKCSKGFPKEFSDKTNANVNGYPIYQHVPTIWNKYKDFMIEDFVNNNVVNPENMALNHIQQILINNGSSCEKFQLPNPTEINIYETEYNVDEEKIRGDYLLSTLNDEQKYVYDIVMRAIENENEPKPTLLKGGRTYHSLFKLTIPIDDAAKSNIRGNSQAARELINAKLIIWDEVSMTVGHALTVDKLLKDLMKNDQPFGGK